MLGACVLESHPSPGKQEENMRKMFRKAEAGFTLIEMLIVVLLVGILAAIAAPVYFGYTKDARTSEAKAIIGSLWTALQGCSQAAIGTACTVAGQYARAGLTGGTTVDGRWTVAVGAANTVTMDATTNKLGASATPLTELDGVTGKDTAGLKVRFSWDNTALTGSFQCDTGGGTFTPC
jgi:type IV pilus assembly protein PilA